MGLSAAVEISTEHYENWNGLPRGYYESLKLKVFEGSLKIYLTGMK